MWRQLVVMVAMVQSGVAFLSSPTLIPHRYKDLWCSSSTNHNNDVSVSSLTQKWSPTSWTNAHYYQSVDYPNTTILRNVQHDLSQKAPLIFAGEAEALKRHLAYASHGHRFIVMGGDCAESFDEFSVNKIKEDLHLLLQMAVVLMYGCGKPVVPIGRIAGQFAKPRSASMEIINGSCTMNVYRGDIINGHTASVVDRIPDPHRMIKAYHQSVQTLNLIRAFLQGGYSHLDYFPHWQKKFTPFRQVYRQIQDARRFLNAMGMNKKSYHTTNSFYTGHECLLLEYEQCLTRQDSISQQYYDCSAHFLWLGERTRQLDSAHVEFLRGIQNPIGIKLSHTIQTDELITLLDRLNPQKEQGKICLITRMGKRHILSHLPAVVHAIVQSHHPVCWICDPMHGNTRTPSHGHKTRWVEDIMFEINAFFDILYQYGAHPGGIHLEQTGWNVTECIDRESTDIISNYQTLCDPRLNYEQAMTVAFHIAHREHRRWNERHTIL